MSAFGEPPAQGQAVEVWNESLQRWVPNFEIADLTERGYHIRRSDGSELPVEFSRHAVRPTTLPALDVGAERP